METVARVRVTRELGVQGDFRGATRPGKSLRRQVSLIEAESWTEAMADLGLDLPWFERRANLLTAGIRLPREPGAIIAIGPSLRIKVTGECDPCSRMEQIAPGLKAALIPDWRGGVLGTVIAEGDIALDDEITILPQGTDQ